MRNTHHNHTLHLHYSAWEVISVRLCMCDSSGHAVYGVCVCESDSCVHAVWCVCVWETEHVSGAERGASGERSVQNIVGARSGFLSKGWSDRSVSLRYRSHHEPRACTNPPKIHLCLQQLTKPSAYRPTSKIVRCEGEMEFVKYFKKQTDRSYRCTIPVKKNRR